MHPKKELEKAKKLLKDYDIDNDDDLMRLHNFFKNMARISVDELSKQRPELGLGHSSNPHWK